MASVTQRIKQITQPVGGHLKPSELKCDIIMDNNILHTKENISPSIVGLVVDYLTRFMLEGSARSAFDISLTGARCAVAYGNIKSAYSEAESLIDNVIGLDDISIASACKLASFDVWFRNTAAALAGRKESSNFVPDANTADNIKILVERNLHFFELLGPVTKFGFSFELFGYTSTVNTGDGDYLTEKGLWDIKVSKFAPNANNTLQILMYWIMGKHS